MKNEQSDFLYGMPAIASFLGLGVRQAYHLKEAGNIPTFKIGGKVCARRSTLTQWLESREVSEHD